jgi:hypothetical protein
MTIPFIEKIRKDCKQYLQWFKKGGCLYTYNISLEPRKLKLRHRNILLSDSFETKLESVTGVKNLTKKLLECYTFVPDECHLGTSVHYVFPKDGSHYIVSNHTIPLTILDYYSQIGVKTFLDDSDLASLSLWNTQIDDIPSDEELIVWVHSCKYCYLIPTNIISVDDLREIV